MPSPDRRAFTLGALLFFASGALGLGYELVWIRKAALVVGASQIALSTVLTAFFLGLGAGSWLVGRHLRRLRWPPLMVYGLFEAAIGLFALSFPALFQGLEVLYGALHPTAAAWSIGAWPFGLLALRFVLLFLLFLVPTFLMGGTFPLLLEGLIEETRSSGPRISLLYGTNVLGAVLGVLVTSYIAIPRLGMNGASTVGGFLNLALGLLAVLCFRRRSTLPRPLEGGAPERFFPLAAFGSGLLAIGYQVCWARYFTLFHLQTVYLSAMLLAVYLLALAAGSFLLAPLLLRRWKPLSILAVAQALAPLAALGALDWWRAAEHRTFIRGTISDSGEVVASPTLEIESGHHHWTFLSEALDATFCAPLFQTALVIFLPVVLLGVGLPALIAAGAGRSPGLSPGPGRISGEVVFGNTLGASAGSFLTGYALLPGLGLHWTLFSLGLGSILLAGSVGFQARALERRDHPESRMERRHGERPRRPPALLWFGGAALLGVLALSLLRGDLTRRTIENHGFGSNQSMELVQVLEGPLNTSFVFEDPGSIRIGSGNVSLAVVEKEGPSTQAIQGHLPCLFYPGSGAPEDCLGLCLGSGQSFGALLLHPIRSLDVVEISGEILELALRHFAPYNHDLGRDPRVKLHLDDGRHFVGRAESARYDLVSMEPPPPTAEGVHSLYSLEFYREVARVLRPGGVFMQWLPLYQLTPRDTLGVLKTQAEVFPQTFVVKASNEEFMALSYPTRPRFHRAALEARCRVLAGERFVEGRRWNAGCRHDLASVEGVLSLIILGPEELRRLPAPAIYRDDAPLLSYSSGDRWLLRRYQGPLLSGLSFAALTLGDFSKLGDYLDPPLSAEMAADLERERAASLAFFQVPDPVKLSESVEAFRTASRPSERQALALSLAETFDAALRKEEAHSWLEKALEADPAGGGVEGRKRARKIAENRLAVFHDLTERLAARLEKKYPRSPLVEELRAALGEFRGREAKRLSGYLLP